MIDLSFDIRVEQGGFTLEVAPPSVRWNQIVISRASSGTVMSNLPPVTRPVWC